MIHSACYVFPLGTLRITAEEGRILSIRRVSSSGAENRPCPVTDLAAAQLQEYFEGKRKSFDFPIAPTGTAFQQNVWGALSQIPYGQTRSYAQIACAAGHPNAARAVGQACSQNPIWVVIPCHRVTGSNHSLTGYAGGLDMKQRLLELEASNS